VLGDLLFGEGMGRMANKTAVGMNGTGRIKGFGVGMASLGLRKTVVIKWQ